MRKWAGKDYYPPKPEFVEGVEEVSFMRGFLSRESYNRRSTSQPAMVMQEGTTLPMRRSAAD